MEFTDENLKRLKRAASGVVLSLNVNGEFILSLLARLEAAEKCARWFDMLNVKPKDSEPFRDYLQWRKVSGK